MEKVDLTVSIEKIKLDALTYALTEKGGDTPLKELEKRMRDFYEETVPPDLRGYVEYMIAVQTPRSHFKKTVKTTAASAPGSRSAQAQTQEMRMEVQDEPR